MKIMQELYGETYIKTYVVNWW